MTIYIYESPDKGKTVYRRVFGDYDNKELITQPDGSDNEESEDRDRDTE
jgi:hypothetical protein